MAHRRTLRTLSIHAAALAVVLVLGAGCRSTPDDGGDVPLPPAAGLDRPGDVEAPEPLPGTDAPLPGPHVPTPRYPEIEPDTAGDAPADADADGAPPRWCPPAGTVVRLAGISPRDMLPMLETRTVREGDDPAQHEIDVTVGVLGGPEEDVARETYVVTIAEDEVRVALAPDPMRRIPGPAREMPRRPTVGQTWETPAGRCRVEAVRQDVSTFEGTRSGCVRVRVTSPTGRVTYRWFDPELGEVRREVLDLEDRVLAAWALCGPEPPEPESFREVLLEGI